MSLEADPLRIHLREALTRLHIANKLLHEAVDNVTCSARFSEPNKPAQYSDCNKCWHCRVLHGYFGGNSALLGNTKD
jgi:hypothetical protein